LGMAWAAAGAGALSSEGGGMDGVGGSMLAVESLGLGGGTRASARLGFRCGQLGTLASAPLSLMP
jgi:hypothetical protein